MAHAKKNVDKANLKGLYQALTLYIWTVEILVNFCF